MNGTSLTEIVAHSGGQLVGRPSSNSDRLRVFGISHDSRGVRNNDLFACIPGEKHDGHLYAAEAVKAGAAALLVERELDSAVPQIIVPDVRKALGPIAATINGHPSKHLKVVGVTGTAGKTTTAHALTQILRSCGLNATAIGTLDGARTTPEAPELQSSLAHLLDGGTDWVCMEVSSHGLELGRVDGTDFVAAMFTNLSPEHLDFHGDMDRYFAAKSTLFDERSQMAVVSIGDEWGRRLAHVLSASRDVVEVDPNLIQDPQITANGARFVWREKEITTPLIGYFNLLNLLLAAETLNALGFEPAAIARGLQLVDPVRGRMEPVLVAGSDLRVLVDYSHKPEALSQALKAARSIAAGRVWVVFGAGGDRDREKRPLMGEVANDLADEVIITSDNPRSENPSDIADEILVGAGAGSTKSRIILDRAEAIRSVIGEAKSGDLILVAGKGHETHQTIGAQRRPFDDALICQQALLQRVEGDGR